MKELLTRDFDQEEFLGYQREILSLGLCSMFLPVSFWNREGRVLVQYDITGYQPLSRLKRISMNRSLEYIQSLARGIVNAQNIYIFPGQYEVNKDTVFISEDEKDVKLIFLPKRDFRRDISVFSALSEGGSYIYSITSEQGKPYVNRALKLIKENRYGMENTLKALSKLSSDVYRFRIEEEGFSFFFNQSH